MTVENEFKEAINKQAKTIGQLNEKGKEDYCRGCYKNEAECNTCFLAEFAKWEEEKNTEIKSLKSTLDEAETKQKLQQLNYSIQDLVRGSFGHINNSLTELTCQAIEKKFVEANNQK